MGTNGQSGIILAGGQSTRMGRNKALLPVDGKPLLRHLAERMLTLGMKRIIVACGTEAKVSEYGALLRGMPGEIVFAVDHYPDCGPLAGLHAALTAMPESGYGFAMACDMPVISVTLYESMRLTAGAIVGLGMAPSMAAKGGNITDDGESMTSFRDPAVFPQLIRTAHQPFHALYHTSAVGELEQRLERGDLRVMSLLGALRSIELVPTLDEEAAFVNLNTPELYEQYLRLSAKL